MTNDGFDGESSSEPGSGSVTLWISDLKNGSPAAAGPLWDRYFARLIGLARLHLQGTPRAVADEEDAALSAFQSFVANAQAQGFPRLDNRVDFWRLLATITVRKAIRQREMLARVKRGGRPGGSDELVGAGTQDDPRGLDQLADPDADHVLALALADEVRQRLADLDDGTLRQVALLRIDGHSVAEIAAALGMSKASVDRKLSLIRSVWLASEPD